MAVENWIDEICKLWEISDGRGGTVYSFRVYEKADFPEAITDFPCALTYVTEVESHYSLGGPLIDYWKGVTEFHLFEGVEKSHYPEVMLYFARIRNAAAASMTLSGKVDHFMLRTGEASILGPVTFTYGAEAHHLGIQVFWVCKENVTGEAGYTPAI